MKGEILKAAWTPGLPHVLNGEKSLSWKKLAEGYTKLGQRISELKPDVLVIYSTQWLSVLGTSFQTQPNPKGVHVDENWYELGDLPYDFKSDAELSTQFALDFKEKGFPTKTVNFEEFPIDTGTIVANRFLNPNGKIPVSIVSSWVYADAKISKLLGETMAMTIEKSGKKAVIIANSLLSARFNPDEISPGEDQISNEDDEANRKVLKSFENGNWKMTANLVSDFSKTSPMDMQFNALHWLSGILGERSTRAEILTYGPQWGTGAAVIDIH